MTIQILLLMRKIPYKYYYLCDDKKYIITYVSNIYKTIFVYKRQNMSNIDKKTKKFLLGKLKIECVLFYRFTRYFISGRINFIACSVPSFKLIQGKWSSVNRPCVKYYQHVNE